MKNTHEKHRLYQRLSKNLLRKQLLLHQSLSTCIRHIPALGHTNKLYIESNAAAIASKQRTLAITKATKAGNVTY